MTSTAFLNGHEIFYSEKKKDWFYKNGQKTDEFRKCPECGELPTKKGHDACLYNLPGVKYACCGHGVDAGYIIFNDDTEIRFNLLEIKRNEPTNNLQTKAKGKGHN